MGNKKVISKDSASQALLFRSIGDAFYSLSFAIALTDGEQRKLLLDSYALLTKAANYHEASKSSS